MIPVGMDVLMSRLVLISWNRSQSILEGQELATFKLSHVSIVLSVILLQYNVHHKCRVSHDLVVVSLACLERD